MPDLGSYAFWILAAYAASGGLIGALILWGWLRGARVRRALAGAEAREGEQHG